jgi:hypothetical protein
MDDFMKNATTLSWWLGVVLVGVVLNLFSAYIKSPLDDFLARMSTWWASRSAAAARSRAKQILELNADPMKQLLLLADEARARHSSTFFLLFAIMLLAISVYLYEVGTAHTLQLSDDVLRRVAAVTGVLCTFVSMEQYRSADQLYRLLRQARSAAEKTDG